MNAPKKVNTAKGKSKRDTDDDQADPDQEGVHEGDDRDAAEVLAERVEESRREHEEVSPMLAADAPGDASLH